MQKQRINDFVVIGGLLVILLLAGPLLGVWLRGEPLAPYLQFPPKTLDVEPSSFSWLTFGAMLLFVILTTWPFWKRLGKGSWRWKEVRNREGKFPRWGWLAAAATIGFWILAWSRFDWFEPFQRLTFFPLWFSFTVTLNALAEWISGRSVLTRYPLYFTLLFPVSSVFWWLFEYLNRFVNNWHYVAVDELGGWQYFWEATLPFSTVLPAVMSALYLLLRLPVFKQEYQNFPSLPWLTSPRLWTLLGGVAILGLIGIGWSPDVMFPLLWIAPGVLWISLGFWRGSVHSNLKDVSRGDLRLVWASAMAALVCGFFWEMWNVYSAAKWQYNVPGVERFYLFEMPALGYAGYLPFGVVCLLIGTSLFSALWPEKKYFEEF
ncbi:MAG: hypothetical protein WD599_04455 [Balneolaceae bacterium]